MRKANGGRQDLMTPEKSFFLKHIDRFITYFYSLLINGVFGKFFTDYSSTESLFRNSFVYRKLKSLRLFEKIGNKLKKSVARAFENSCIINAVSNFLASLLKRKLKEYGVFFSIIGVGGLTVYAVGFESFEVLIGNIAGIVTCTALLVLGIACAVSKKTVAEAFFESHILSALLFEGFGIQKDYFETDNFESKGYAYPIIFGVFFGAFTYVVDPVFYVVAFLLILAFTLIMLFPELGILSLFAAIPFVVYFEHPSFVLLSVVAVTSISYFIKFFRGKRVFKLRFIDFVIIGFGFLMLLSGIFSIGGNGSFKQASLYCTLMAAYFPTVNLIRSKEWVKRSVITFVTFSALAAIIGVFQSFSGGFESGWLDSSDFSGITVRITSTFENPNVYAAYLLLVIPFILSGLLESRNPKKISFYVISILISVYCMIETWSRGAWLGLCLSLVLYFLVYSRKSLPYIAVSGTVGVLGISLFAPNVSERFVSIGNLADTSVSYRISAWKGIAQMLRANWFSGIGFGEAAFSAVYPMFAYSGATAVKHAHSLYLQIMTETGIVGLLIFGAIILLFVRNCFEYLYCFKTGDGRGTVIAGLSAMFGISVMGLTDYVWYNSRIFLAFWLVMALVNAHIRVGFADRNRLADNEKNTVYAADMEIDPNNL